MKFNPLDVNLKKKEIHDPKTRFCYTVAVYGSSLLVMFFSHSFELWLKNFIFLKEDEYKNVEYFAN